MALIVKHLLDHIQDTLGGGDPPTGIDTLNIMNQAGEHLHSMHAWRWASKRSALLSTRGTISGTSASWNATNLTLTLASAFSAYAFVEGDELEITDGTGVTQGFYEIDSKTDGNTVVLAASIGSTATDVAFTLQPYSIDLPDDLRDIISIVGTARAQRNINLTTMAEVLRAREDVGTNDYFWYGAVTYAGTPPTPILEIGPGAGSTVAGAFRLFYRSRWARLSSDSTRIEVPEFCEALLLQLVRAFARGYVREDQSSLSARLYEIEQGPLFRAAVMSDGNIQPYSGRIRGGGATIFRNRHVSDFYETSSRIDPPS